ncbi:ferredoxin reductase family protein [Thiorhodovibrio frisius]|uniref:Putative ferric reductase n=1 Tax=Thiorhodovibrio frisius TaxID=631362 RepID=H8Z5P2_9GAMM|nr:ferric reductase-like transmembrane domain-containing protein [Thiorhodovibrio frisius]EIC19526.1 putative ferric reductase [Thiorhodovibrio frisius]WPL20511.1 Anthranilate 1,2-dioxygenase electron transfer component [Thiorhodovibrio frisius]
MNIYLTGFIALLVLAWAGALAVSGPGTNSLPWAIQSQAFYLSGLLAIGLMSLVMVLATRPTWLERPLGGMDRVYRLHKWTAILAVTFAAMHWLLEEGDDLIKSMFGCLGQPQEEEFSGLLHDLRDVGEELGEIGIYLLLAMVILSLLKRFPYNIWRHIHRAMPLLYLALAFHAAMLAPSHYWSQPLGLLLGVLLVVGSFAAVMTLLGLVGHTRRARGTILSISTPSRDVTEVVCQLDSRWRGHCAGQFAFVNFDRWEGHHPFTIASADHGGRRVTFLIKALGDFTRALPQRIAVGQAVTVEGPYGFFELPRRNPEARQIWVAGGIGITPFIAWLEALRANPDASLVTDLHYSTRNQESDPFVERLKSLCADLPGVSLHIHDSQSGSTLSAEHLASMYEGLRKTEVWFCGPRRFAKQLRTGLNRAWRGHLQFHQEAFEMR